MEDQLDDSYFAIAGAVIYGGRTSSGTVIGDTPAAGLPALAMDALLNTLIEIPGTVHPMHDGSLKYPATHRNQVAALEGQ